MFLDIITDPWREMLVAIQQISDRSGAWIILEAARELTPECLQFGDRLVDFIDVD